jgi:hypothetical protein
MGKYKERGIGHRAQGIVAEGRRQKAEDRGQRELRAEFGLPWCDLMGLDYFRLN